MVGAKLATMQQGARTDLGRILPMSNDQAATLLNISTFSIKGAKKVSASATRPDDVSP